MTDKHKIKLMYNFAINLHDRGLALDPEKWDYEKIAWEYLSKTSKLSKKNKNDLSPDVMPSLLPCGEVGCQNPHERVYRGCDICKFKKQ